MSGLFKGLGKLIKTVGPKVLPIAASMIPGVGPIASAGLSALTSFAATAFTSRGEKALSADPEIAAAQRRQAALLSQQQVVADRQRAEADRREAELDGSIAAQRRALTARRRGRAGLSFGGAQGKLKTTLGG